MTKIEKIHAFAETFVSGYVAGSSNSYNECKEVLAEELKEHFDIVDLGHVECVLDNAIAEAEIFLCNICGWWCWAHEQAFSKVDECVECNPEEEDNE